MDRAQANTNHCYEILFICVRQIPKQKLICGKFLLSCLNTSPRYTLISKLINRSKMITTVKLMYSFGRK